MRTTIRFLALCALLALSPGCLAPAPNLSVESPSGIVRSDSEEEARAVSTLLERLAPRVTSLVPDSSLEEVEVWIQERPSLYRRPREASADAEGLWAESHGRILLGRYADSLERTLAHELVHASLGETWRALPGSLEEGLCDHVSARVSSKGGARLRAGRLASAALSCGGISLELSARPRREPGDETWGVQIFLSSPEALAADPLDVFRIQAGLSSTSIGASQKRGYYGLSFLVVERIVARHGLDGLAALCRSARERDLSTVPRRWLLDAAQLGPTPDLWRTAAISALQREELTELVRMYIDPIAGALAPWLRGCSTREEVEAKLREHELLLTLGPASGALDLSTLDFVRRELGLRYGTRRP